MRKLNTTPISETAQFPFKKGTLDHLQLAYQEALTALANSIIGRMPDTSNLYVLYGCTNSGTDPNFNISAGAVYYNGEVYLVDATSFTAAAGQTAVANIDPSQYNAYADPVTFTDGLARNVHDILKMKFTSKLSGSGICDFNNMLQVPSVLVKDVQPSLPANLTINFKQDRAIFYQAAPVSSVITFDFTNAVPGSVVRMKWTFTGYSTLTINVPVNATIIKDSGDLGLVGSRSNLLYFLYCGKNELGYDEVSYTVKQV